MLYVTVLLSPNDYTSTLITQCSTRIEPVFKFHSINATSDKSHHSVCHYVCVGRAEVMRTLMIKSVSFSDTIPDLKQIKQI